MTRGRTTQRQQPVWFSSCFRRKSTQGSPTSCEKPSSKKNSSTSFTTETRVVRKNRSAGVSPASEPRQLLLGQHDLCRLEAGDTFFLTTTEYTEMHGEP